MELDYTYWQGEGWLVGYLNDYPAHKTQGKNIAELEEMLLDVYENIQVEARRKKELVLKTGKIKVPA
jgi:hypothetical protein